MNSIDSLRAHAERIRAAGVLGRSRAAERLFDYLVECSANDRAPKEVEVAVDVFGKDSSFDVSQDAMVRVYVHKLRRKLEEFYAGPGHTETERLTIPKGTYRFVLVNANESVEPEPDVSELVAQRPTRARWIAGLIVVALLSACLGAWVMYAADRARDPAHAVRQNAVWASILNDDRPIFVVVGDYYIFGETDESHEVLRLVREFDINSQQDLERYLQLNPDLADRYLDVEMTYLPTASAFALSGIAPVLAPAGRRLRVAMMSEVNPAILKSSNVIYLGYLSGLGRLQNLIFSGSRFTIGETYDELVDRQTQRRYVSQVGSRVRDMRYNDYGYFSTFEGPSGNRIMVIAGTRDVALMQTAEAVTNAARLEQLVAQRSTSSFEALYEVYGMDRLNLNGRLLLTAELDVAKIWTDEPYGAVRQEDESR